MKKKLLIIFGIIICIILIFISIIFITKNNNPSGNLSEKGSRDNPYNIGEKISINEAYNRIDSQKQNFTYSASITIEKKYTLQEGIDIRKEKYDRFNTVPVVDVSFKIDGDDSNSSYYDQILDFTTLDENLESGGCFLENEDQKQISEIYTGKEYKYRLTRSYDRNAENSEINYIIINYYDKNYNKKSIYVRVSDTNNDNEVISNIENNNEIGSGIENNSKEEKNYKKAISAFDKGYYTIAKNIFKDLNEYKDSKNRYNSCIDILKEFNGTYYGDSTEYSPAKIYLYVYNGEVRAQFEGGPISSSKYELFKYGSDQNGIILAFSDSKTNMYLLDDTTEYSKNGWAINKTNDNDYVVAATTGSTTSTWNGLFYKTSDTVNDLTIFE